MKKIVSLVLSTVFYVCAISTANSTDLPWKHIGHANSVVAMAGNDGHLFAATSDHKLWYRPPASCDINWSHIGHAINVVAMTFLDGKLFAATSDNKLWARDPVLSEIDWEHVGHANNVVAMTAIDGRLFAATADNRLWAREPVLRDIDWVPIGHANNIAAMAAANDLIFAATTDGTLVVRDPVLRDVNWRRVGHAHQVVAMAASWRSSDPWSSRTQLYAATRDNKLWARSPNTFTAEYCSSCSRSAARACRSNDGVAFYGFGSGRCFFTCGNGAGGNNRAITGSQSGICEQFANPSHERRCERL